MRALAVMLMAILLAAASAAPAAAQTDRRFGQLDQSLGQLYPAQQPDVSNITLSQFLAIGVGAMTGAALVQLVLEGSSALIAGAIIGGLIGDWWFKERLWPFETHAGTAV